MPRIRTLAYVLPLLQVTASCTSSTPDDSPVADTAATATTGETEFRFAGDFSGPLGVQLYSFRNAFDSGDVAGTLARVRALGFREVELAGTYGLSAQDFRRLLDSAGLRATSMHVGYERMRDSLPAVLAEAKALGTTYVGTAWIPHDGSFTLARARQAAADFDRWGKATQVEGVQFFYHIHGYEFKPGANGVLPLDILMRETNSDAVKFEMDVFWTALPGADPAAVLAQYPGRWRLMHLKDIKQGYPIGGHTGVSNSDSSETPVGSGQVDFRAVLRAAKQAGVERYYVQDETVEPFRTIPVSTKWLESVK